jgi:hypothetical protein
MTTRMLPKRARAVSSRSWPNCACRVFAWQFFNRLELADRITQRRDDCPAERFGESGRATNAEKQPPQRR